MTLIRWNPYRHLAALPLDLDTIFDSSRPGSGLNSESEWSPSVDVVETKDGYELRAEVPGIKKEDIRISFEGGLLTLKGEKKNENEEKKENFHRVERVYGRFERSFRLPDGIKADGIKAKYDSGVLTVVIPKAEEAKPKEISVTVE
jgi:HSP20 family protein